MTVQVYWNTHLHLWSVRLKDTGRVTNRHERVVLANVRFVVQPGGQAKCRESGVKNVHAWAEGQWIRDEVDLDWLEAEVRYDPFRDDGFVQRYVEEPVTEAALVLFDIDEGRSRARFLPVPHDLTMRP